MSKLNPAPVATGSKQTMASWAKAITSREEIPDAYKGFFESRLTDAQAFPHVVLVPAMMGFRRNIAEKLICDLNDIVYVLTRTGDQVAVSAYPLDTIRDVEVGTILMYSWITITGVTRDGLTESSQLAFSSATLRHFVPFLSKIRPASTSGTPTELQAEQTKFDYLATLNFKFMNYARSSLVAGEEVVYTLWQPEIREMILPQLRLPFYRTISTAHLTVLTDKELIIIREDERSSRRKEKDGERYGGVWRYIPLRSVGAISMEPQGKELAKLIIQLKPAGHIESTFAASTVPGIEEFRKAIGSL